jgi:hypothetical protein
LLAQVSYNNAVTSTNSTQRDQIVETYSYSIAGEMAS